MHLCSRCTILPSKGPRPLFNYGITSLGVPSGLGKNCNYIRVDTPRRLLSPCVTALGGKKKSAIPTVRAGYVLHSVRASSLQFTVVTTVTLRQNAQAVAANTNYYCIILRNGDCPTYPYINLLKQTRR